MIEPADKISRRTDRFATHRRSEYNKKFAEENEYSTHFFSKFTCELVLSTGT